MSAPPGGLGQVTVENGFIVDNDVAEMAHEGPTSVPVLLIPRSEMEREIRAQIDSGRMLELRPREKAWDKWHKRNLDLLKTGFSTSQVADEYEVAFPPPAPAAPSVTLDVTRAFKRRFGPVIYMKIRALEGIRARLALYEPSVQVRKDDLRQAGLGSRVFVVHGHDTDAKYQVTEFLERVTGKRPVIFHEFPDLGRTIIEKFEALAAGAGFAVVLLTADDEGRPKGDEDWNKRARQNVVLELGFFIGILGRGRVVALHDRDVELPSDLTGVLYKPLAGNWHTELAKELRAAGINVNLERLAR